MDIVTIVGIIAGLFTVIGVYVQIKEYREKRNNNKKEAVNINVPAGLDTEGEINKGDGIKAEIKLKERLEVAEEGGNSDKSSEISLILGELSYNKGELDEAKEYFSSAREYFLTTSDYKNLSRALIGLASVYTASGNHEDAISASKQAEKITDSPKTIMEAKLRLGICHRRLGNFSEALNELNNSLGISKNLNSSTFSGEIYLAIGDVFWKLNRWDEAEVNYRESMSVLSKELLSHPKNDLARFHLAQVKYAIGRVYLENQRYKESEKILKESFRTLEGIGNFFGIEMCTQLLGRLYEKMGEHRKSRQWYHESFVATYITGNELRLVETLFFLAQIAQKMNDGKRAETLASSAAIRAEKQNLLEQYVQLLVLLGNIYSEESAIDTAIESYKKSILAAVRVSPTAVDSIFLNLSEGVDSMRRKSRKGLAIHILQELIQWWTVATIDGTKAIDFENENLLKSTLTQKSSKISTHLLGLYDVIIS